MTVQDNDIIKFKSSGFDFELATNEETKVEEAKASFINFTSDLLNLENLIVLAGSGTSLTFNPQNSDSYFAPSMWHLWEICKKISSFDEVLAITKYSDIDPQGAIKPDIEKLLSLVDQCLGLVEGTQKSTLSNFKQEAIEAIFQATNFVLDKELELEESWASHRQFINKFGQRKSKHSRLKIFTTNYDMAFEKAASDEGFVIIDGFDFSKPHRFNPMWYQYDIVRRSEHNGQQGAFLDNVLQLYKLHGSVDWRRMNGEVQKTAESESRGDKVIIYPSSSKYKTSYESPYMDMISSFTHALKQPNTGLVCVGFGFNDEHLNSAINMALRTNTSLHVLVATRSLFATTSSFNGHALNTFRTLIEKNNSKRIALLDADFDSFINLVPAHGKQSPDTLSFQAQLKTLLGGMQNA